MPNADASSSDPWRIAPATHGDLPAILDFAAECERAEYGSPDTAMLGGVEIVWGKTDFDPSRDAWLARDAAGQLIGYAHSNPGDPIAADGGLFIHPVSGPAALGAALCRVVEAHARERIAAAPASAPPQAATLIIWAAATNAPTHQALVSEGFRLERHQWGMELALADEPPPAPQWPAGITVRTCESNDDLRRAFAVIDEAFRDGWGYVSSSFDEFSQSTIQIAGFDPTLWLLAVETASGAVVGTALCEALPDRGWVTDLAVLGPFRGRGLGEALLRHAFRDFHARGLRLVGLGVDSENPNGAPRLYERVGMRIERQYDVFRKPMRG